MQVQRRGMLGVIVGSSLGLGAAALGAAAALWAAAVARFLRPNVSNRPPSTFRAGFPADYAEGRVEAKFAQSHGVWIVRGTYRGRPQLYALRTTCTHLGCITLWQEGRQKFQCPCHGSGFSKEGINVEGPAPRPLERCAIRLADDGQLEIDRSRTFQQQLGEWNDPESYIALRPLTSDP
jgi:cytochrome b6-f complex iron-sulfur subunit